MANETNDAEAARTALKRKALSLIDEASKLKMKSVGDLVRLDVLLSGLEDAIAQLTGESRSGPSEGRLQGIAEKIGGFKDDVQDAARSVDEFMDYGTYDGGYFSDEVDYAAHELTKFLKETKAALGDPSRVK